jgi:hypothetical protein
MPNPGACLALLRTHTMNINIYFIDDSNEKAKKLPIFLDWLGSEFPWVNFKIPESFQDPVRASGDADLIWEALNDPHGVLLLDLQLPGDSRIDAADDLLKLASKEFEEVTPIWKILHEHEDTKLAASIVCLAHHLSCPIIWVTTQNMDTSLYSQLNVLPIQYPQFPWDHKKSWPDHVDRLAPMAERGFRESYLDAAAKWKHIGKEVRAEKWSVPGAVVAKLFPDDGVTLGHNVSEHDQQCLLANAIETEKVLAPIFTKLGISMPDVKERLFILKAISRGGSISGQPNMGTQLYVTTLLKAFHVSEDQLLYPNWIANFTGVSAGAVLFAACTLSGVPNPPKVVAKLTDPWLSIKLEFSYKDANAAQTAVATFQLTPRQRMILDNRDTPGTVVLALDYLRPFEIEQNGNAVSILIKRPVQPVS